MRSYRVGMWAAVALLVSACGDYGGASGGGSGNGDVTGDAKVSSERELFDQRVHSQLETCRLCHQPGASADTDKGRRFMLSDRPAEDYAHLKASWERLDRGVESNRILTKASNTDAEPHTGGTPWPKDGPAWNNARALLACWDNPAGCAAILAGLGGGVVEQLPLLGNPGKHFFVSQICDGKDDATPIDWTQDPRRLMTDEAGLIDSEDYAVHFNDPFQLCHTDTLLANQAEQNRLRVAAGKKPIHSAKAYAKTCGEWRARVQEGHDFIAMTPTDTPRSGGHGNSNALVSLAASSDAPTWNKLWQVWGLSERPSNYDESVFERYGHSPPPPHIYNPYPVIDPAKGIDETPQLSKTFGGTGRLPLGWAQGRDAEGRYNGKLGLTCFSCHAGQVGTGEIAGRDGLGHPESYGKNPTGSYMGLPNTNTELGVLLADLIHAQQPADYKIPAIGYIPVVNTTRGTNAADTEIEAIVAIRDFDTLNFQHVFVDPVHGSYGDQDPPAWWWLHNKTRYLWFGGHSTDSSRGNMYFGSVNGLSGDEVLENEGIFESVHDWSLTVEAPAYPGPVNTALAEQGAVLFHEKNLWADEANADIPQPKGNGSCAGCHGAYSPRYIGDPRFLPDPKLAGSVGYTVPLEIIDTDPAQAEGWSREVRPHVSTMWWSYPDAQPDYLFPEKKDPLTEGLDDYAFTDGISGETLADHLGRTFAHAGALQPLSTLLMQLSTQLSPVSGLPLGASLGRVKGACSFEEKTVGYVTPPLHGVWASAPYFHNGSVPDVWSVLKPEDRPTVWRRQRTTTDVNFNAFETRLSGPSGGYDFDKLGWKHDVLACDTGGQGIPYYQCQPAQAVPPELSFLFDTVDGGLIWPMWVVPPPVGDQGLADRMIFNTNMYSKKNRGHAWTKVLTDAERRALIEYLKTL